VPNALRWHFDRPSLHLSPTRSPEISRSPLAVDLVESSTRPNDQWYLFTARAIAAIIAGKLHMLRVECTRLRARQHEQMDVRPWRRLPETECRLIARAATRFAPLDVRTSVISYCAGDSSRFRLMKGTHPVKATGEADVRTLMGSRRTHVQVSWCTIRGSGSCSDLRRRAPIPRQEIADPPVGVVG
jgi:hypothetical protein